jgi:NADH:ubiquinone oxidoreductase subunit E
MPATDHAVKPIDLVVCMGSACFSRGNIRTLDLIQRYLKEHDLEKEVLVTGTLCQDRCRQGPNVMLQGECFCGMEPKAILGLLEERLGHPSGDAP